LYLQWAGTFLFTSEKCWAAANGNCNDYVAHNPSAFVNTFWQSESGIFLQADSELTFHSELHICLRTAAVIVAVFDDAFSSSCSFLCVNDKDFGFSLLMLLAMFTLDYTPYMMYAFLMHTYCIKQ